MGRITGQAVFLGLFWFCPLLAALPSNGVLAEPHNLHLALQSYTDLSIAAESSTVKVETASYLKQR